MAQQAVVGELVSHGSVQPETKTEAVKAALGYFNELKEHRDERAVRERWEESGVGSLEAYLYETTEVERPAPGDTSATTSETVPRVHALEPQQLSRIIDELNELAKDLGFAPRVNEPTPRDDPDMNDIRGLLQARGQTEAAGRVPEQPGE
jgi:hypothetical protein